MSEYILKMQNITKEFPGVKALDKVNINVKRGEIHCICGENGAGKSTLMKVLSGVYPDGTFEGEILLDGKKQSFKNIAESEKEGIAIIYQELALVPEIPIYENIFLGHEFKKRFLIDWDRTISEANELLKRVKLNVNSETKPKDLSVGKQQLVEIAKALSKNVKLLIFDEPTSSLNEVDSENLLLLMKDLKDKGITSIMISHKLKEVLSVADTITVIRDGQTICELDGATATEDDIIRNMVGRSIEDVFPKRTEKNIGKIVLEAKNINATSSKSDKKILDNINFSIRRGEVVGIAGLMGAGRTEFAHCLFGHRLNYNVTGDILVNGKVVKISNPADAIKNKIAYVSEDRKGDGLILSQDIKQNITLANLRELVNTIVINEQDEINVANKYKKEINIKAPSIEQKVGNLSGGNQQKVSIAKWLYTNPEVLILDEPTRGIDVGAKYEIYTIMNELVKNGMSIIMISSELPEVIGMSDRVYVLNEGKFTLEVDVADATQENIIEAATS